MRGGCSSPRSPTTAAAGADARRRIALGDGGFLEAVQPLMDVKASDPSPGVRQAAAAALKKLAPR